MSSKDPVPLGDALEEVGRRLGLPASGAFEVTVDAWRGIVGAEVGGHTRVRSVHGGECVVEADAPAWASRARYFGRALRERVNDRCGRPVITRVTVVVKGPQEAGSRRPVW